VRNSDSPQHQQRSFPAPADVSSTSVAADFFLPFHPPLPRIHVGWLAVLRSHSLTVILPSFLPSFLPTFYEVQKKGEEFGRWLPGNLLSSSDS
jgi:hypothetical protein